ncbi:glycerol-3-phosphate acyltransferase [Candidatus Gromoviella agglomerans]|uniref:glycerol-3-phosphate acyltransferase n=1 Tax=Candidatus Gromoviella agglomerans TaxID=2806609 RepID=UPI001E359D51|nr:glycerol-3-phosphate acyltransferase [Candidatus Gromoviella agglomerans]UFX98408.1 Glycerol-3-phosphate acyltransferase [Candidatus Gromoviella agglomerans]
MFSTFLWLLFAYCIGSFPFGVVISKLMKISDPRQVGSRNIGATNVFRQSKIAGVLTMLCDLLKGFVVVYVGNVFSFSQLLLLGFFVIFGHIYPIYSLYKFKSAGKGVSTLLGVGLFLDYISVLIAFVFWIICIKVYKISSLASLVGVSVFLLMHVVRAFSYDSLTFAVCVWSLIFFSHKENIRALVAGHERRIV